jgi:hypothetical protein
LTATDFAYAFKRIVDPKIRSCPAHRSKIRARRACEAQDAGSGLDYDAPVRARGHRSPDAADSAQRARSTFPFLLTSTFFQARASGRRGRRMAHPVGPARSGGSVRTRTAPRIRAKSAFRQLFGRPPYTAWAARARTPCAASLFRANRIEFSSTPGLPPRSSRATGNSTSSISRPPSLRHSGKLSPISQRRAATRARSRTCLDPYVLQHARPRGWRRGS